MNGGAEVEPSDVAREALVLLHRRKKDPSATATLEAFASTMARFRMVVLQTNVSAEVKKFLVDNKVPMRALRYLTPHSASQLTKAVLIHRTRNPR